MPRNVMRFLKLFLIFIYLALPVTLAFDDMFVVDRNEWLFSIIILFLLIITIQVRSQIVLTSLSLILSIPICINAAQAASYVLQGSSFNYQFFAHLDFSSLKLAWIAERPRLLLAILYITLAPLIVFIALNTDFRGKKQLFNKYYKQGVFACVMLSLYATYNAPLALSFHLYTVLGYEPRGREFESLRARHYSTIIKSFANKTFPEKFKLISSKIDFSDAPQNKICDGTNVFGLSSLAKMPKSIDEVWCAL